MQKQELPSNTFCILPWIHFFHSPSGLIQPCCAATSNNGAFGTLQNFSNVNDIVNTPAMQQVRQQMLAGERPTACNGCYQEEKIGLRSFRENKNSDILGIDIDKLISNTEPSGKLNNFKMEYWDSRFSNVCNLKCRMCGPEYSHTWAQEQGISPQIIRAHTNSTWEELIVEYGDLSALREVYFAGGESMFQWEHWAMLEHLRQIGKKDIRITYTTNLTKLNFGKQHIETYLQDFSNVLFIVSLDGTDKVIEYIRHGVNWIELQENIKIVQQFPGVKLKFNIVITIYNILTLSDIIDFAIKNTANSNPFDLTVAHGPDNLNITNLPNKLKTLAVKRLSSNINYNKFKNQIDGIINYMSQDPVCGWDLSQSFTNRLDKKRGEDILTIVPEFKEHWDETI